MKVRVLSWAIVLLAHGLVLAWLADDFQAPEPPQALPVLAVDMLSIENQAAEQAAPPAEPPARPEPPPPPPLPAAPVSRPAPQSPPVPKSELTAKKPPRQPRKQEPRPSITQPADPASGADTAPAENGAPASAPSPATGNAVPQAGRSPTPAPTTSIYIPAEYAASNRKPVYPTLSRRYGEEGTVVLRVLVNADGRAGQVEIHSSSGYKLLDQSAQQAVQGWRFAPATNNGQPVSDWFLVPIPFKLHD